MAVGFSNTNKPLNPRGQDASPKGYNRAKLYSGKALDFDGVNDIVSTTYASGFTGAQEFTYCAYVNTDSTTLRQTIIHANENTGYGLQSLQTRDGAFRFFGGTGVAGTSYIDSELYEADKWYFVVGTHTPTENKIYLNGVLNATKEASNLTIAPDEIVVGNYPAIVNPMDGQISNAKVFNVALTAAQVADLYNNPEKVVPTGVDNTALKLWLPMMEGAGTTAYDGSGNGNHGTISGATYVNGIGAPSPQSAVIDWNKGTNYVANSLEIINANFTNNQVSSVSGFEAPDGTQTASKITSLGASSYLAFNSVVNNHKRAIYAKTTSGTGQAHLLTHNSNTNNLFTITEEWQKFSVDSVTSTIGETSFYLIDFRGSSTLSEIIVWAPNSSTTNYNIVPTLSTAQTSEVLLPQGLTTGRDITGVNLFENVRKQGALNLDGNSWAEVHDNESLDITSAITLEAWVKWDTSQNNKGILGRYYTTGNNRSTMLVHHVSGVLRFYTSADGSSTNYVTNTQTLTDGEWYHIVGTSDGSTNKIYVNAQTPNTNTGSSIIAVNIPLEIGRYNQEPTYSYQQPIAQPRIYNRALTAAEVLQNYNSGKNTYK